LSDSDPFCRVLNTQQNRCQEETDREYIDNIFILKEILILRRIIRRPEKWNDMPIYRHKALISALTFGAVDMQFLHFGLQG